MYTNKHKQTNLKNKLVIDSTLQKKDKKQAVTGITDNRNTAIIQRKLVSNLQKAPIQRVIDDDFLAIENDIATTNDPLLKSILEEAIATAQAPNVNSYYGHSDQKSHAEPLGDHGVNRGFNIVIDQNQYTDNQERQSIIIHELLHASADSKYAFNAKHNESAITSPLRGTNNREEFSFAGEQFRYGGKLAKELREQAERDRGVLGDGMTKHVIDRAKRIEGANTQEFDTVASELLYFMKMRNVSESSKTFRKVRNMAEAAYNARNRDIPITEGYIEPDSFKELAVKSACFLTTACAYVHGLSDNCEELTVLRGLRDGYMRRRREDEELIQLYYKLAPRILDAIMKRTDRVQILRSLYSVICHCVEEVKSGKPQNAVLIYKEMVVSLKEKFCPDLQYY